MHHIYNEVCCIVESNSTEPLNKEFKLLLFEEGGEFMAGAT